MAQMDHALDAHSLEEAVEALAEGRRVAAEIGESRGASSTCTLRPAPSLCCALCPALRIPVPALCACARRPASRTMWHATLVAALLPATAHTTAITTAITAAITTATTSARTAAITAAITAALTTALTAATTSARTAAITSAGGERWRSGGDARPRVTVVRARG